MSLSNNFKSFLLNDKSNGKVTEVLKLLVLEIRHTVQQVSYVLKDNSLL